MTTDLRSVARLDRARPFRRVQTIDTVRLAIARLGPVIEATDAAVTYELLPEVFGDALQLETLFHGLLASALRHRRTANPRIRITADVTEQGWRFVVADNGTSRHDPDRDHTAAAFDLAICRIIVERHGGKIWLEPGATGTAVHFTLRSR